MFEKRHYEQLAEIIAEMQDETRLYDLLHILFAKKLDKKNANFKEDRFLEHVDKLRKNKR